MSAIISTSAAVEAALSIPADKEREMFPKLLTEQPLEFALDLIRHPSCRKELRRDIPIYCLEARVHLEKVVEMIQEINLSEDDFFKEDNWHLAFREAINHPDIPIVKDILKKGCKIDKRLHLITILKAAEYKKYDLLQALVENSVSIRSSAITKILAPTSAPAALPLDLTAIKTILATGPIFTTIRDLTLENTSLSISLIKKVLKAGGLDTDGTAFLKQLKKNYTEVRTSIEETATVNIYRLDLAVARYRSFLAEKVAKEFGYKRPD